MFFPLISSIFCKSQFIPHSLVIHHLLCLKLFILLSTKQQYHISCYSSSWLKYVTFETSSCTFYAPFCNNSQVCSWTVIDTEGTRLFGLELITHRFSLKQNLSQHGGKASRGSHAPDLFAVNVCVYIFMRCRHSLVLAKKVGKCLDPLIVNINEKCWTGCLCETCAFTFIFDLRQEKEKRDSLQTIRLWVHST